MSTYARDLGSNLNSVASSLRPAVIRTTTANGTGIDLLNSDGLCNVEVTAGAITDGTHTITVEESDDNSTFVAVTLQQTLTALTSATVAGTVQFATFNRTKRYVRAVTTVTGSPGTGGYYAVNIFEQKKVVGP